jgi:signal transduction histidine kinase
MGRFMMPGRQRPHVDLPAIAAEAAPQPPIAAISEAAVSFPLHVDSQVVGYAELSEGPAFGQAIRDTLQQALLIGGLVALLVAAIAAVVASRQVTRPLLSLREAADEMAQGNLDARADGSKLAEIDHLASQFNDMADQLSSTITSLEAERASLRRFIADASHELRTPLTALKTFNTLLGAEKGALPENGPDLIAESGRQIDHLDHLTTDLLDLSRLEARLSGTDLLSGDIRPVVSEAVAALRPLGEAREQHLEERLPQQPVIVAHDPAALERAVQNLVSNAVKFSPPGSLIQVSLVAHKEFATIHVQDDGPGIPAAEQTYVLERFYRGRGQSGAGSGLGLAIAREIATIHGGQLTFTSTEGEGCQFVLRLPLIHKKTPPAP